MPETTGTSRRVQNTYIDNPNIDNTGSWRIDISGSVDDNNSTTEKLNANITYTGSATEILNCGTIFINVYSNVASATDGLKIQQSSDGTNWDHDDIYTVPASTGKNYSINPHSQYMRVVYINGGSNQTVFRLQTICKGNSTPSSHRIQDTIVDDDDAELVKSVLTAKANGGGFVNIQATESNNLRVTDAESGLAIAMNNVSGTTFIHKFGSAPDFDQSDGEITIWDGAEDGTTWEQMMYVYSTTDDIDSISSENNGDTQDIEIHGLDVNYDIVIQTITLTGQTRKALDINLIRVYRKVNVGSTNLAGHVFCYVNGAISNGIPDDSTTIRAIIHPENNQTEMAIYTVPNGKTGYIRSWYATTSGASRDTNYVIRLRAKPNGQVFQLKHKSAIADAGTSYIHHIYEEPEIFTAKTDIEMTTLITASGISAASISAGFDLVLVDD